MTRQQACFDGALVRVVDCLGDKPEQLMEEAMCNSA